MRTSRLHIVVLAVLAGSLACTPAMRPGALSPMNARVTNEVVAGDQRMLDAWQHRLFLVREQSASIEPSPRREYSFAKASAWLDFARESYALDARDGMADAALREVARLLDALEAGTLPALTSSDSAALRLRPDLWLALDSMEHGAIFRRTAETLAGAEVALARAEYLSHPDGLDAASPSSLPQAVALRRCRQDAQIAKAEQLLDAVRVLATEPPPSPPKLVAVAPPAPAPVPAPTPVTTGQPLRRIVHFALDSSTLAPESRRVLDGVVAVLRGHPRVTVALEGHADPRGDSQYNRWLSERRAESVRRYLAAADSTLDRVTIAAFGADSLASRRAGIQSFARDRRVTVQFYGPDGAPLTAAGLAAIDHDGDLQLESARAARAAGRPAHAKPAPKRRTK